MKCSHTKCHSKDRIWVPCLVTSEGNEVEKIKPHFYCMECGEIEYLGPQRARGLGYFSNVLGDLKRCLDADYKKGGSTKITTALLRLITLELHKIDDFSDHFSKSFPSQKKEFYLIIKKFLPSINRDLFESFFDPNPPQYDAECVNYFGKYYDDLEELYADEIAESNGEEDFCFF